MEIEKERLREAGKALAVLFISPNLYNNLMHAHYNLMNKV